MKRHWYSNLHAPSYLQKKYMKYGKQNYFLTWFSTTKQVNVMFKSAASTFSFRSILWLVWPIENKLAV